VNADALESQHALALRPGVLLADRFRLVRLVRGTSSFAFSYLAEDLTLGDTVIIKEFFPRSLVSRGADGAAIKAHSAECERDFLRALHRFALEGATLAESTHPNLVRVRAVVDANATVYLAMDRHETQPLADYVRGAGGRIASAEAGHLAQQLLAALQVLHAESIIHRDLSPRTVHVGSDGSAVLLEFSARRHLPLHATDLVSGFAAFEQYGMREIGPWTDVYAVSALLYYMLTGNAPPSALERAAGESIASPAASVPGVLPGLARLAVKGLALLPQQRPHAVSELRRQLESVLGEASSAASRNTPSAAATDMSFADLGPMSSDATGTEDDRNSSLRLAAGGIVVPGEEKSARFLRKLGSVASRLRRRVTADADQDTESVEEPELRYTRPPMHHADPPLMPAPLPVVERQPAPVTPSPTFAPLAVTERPEVPAAVAEPPRQFDLATELSFASDDLQARLDHVITRRRYRLAAATALIVVVGGSLALLARNSRASGVQPVEAPRSTAPAELSAPVPSSASNSAHVTVDGGAVLQSAARPAAATTRVQADAPAQNVRGPAAPSRDAPAPRNDAPAAVRDVVVPTARMPNVKVAVSGMSDLKIMPLEMLVDPRTRLANGSDQIEQGEYATAHRTFRSAMLQLDSVATRYPESQAVKNLRHDLELADARAAQACTAENEMRKRRGEQARACQ